MSVWKKAMEYLGLGPDDAYDDIGRGVRSIARGYRDAYEASKTTPRK